MSDRVITGLEVDGTQGAVDIHAARGRVLSVLGGIVDAHFSEEIPSILNELRAGEDRGVVLEVVSQLEEKTVRSTALTPTRGLACGAPGKRRSSIGN